MKPRLQQKVPLKVEDPFDPFIDQFFRKVFGIHLQKNRSSLSEDQAFEILGLSKGATQEEIKKAVRRKCLQFHPDKNPQKEKESKEEFDKRTVVQLEKIRSASELLLKNNYFF